MGRRSAAQIEADYKRIRKLLEDPNFKPTSLQQIADHLGLKLEAVKNSLRRHPIVEKRIVETIYQNKMSQSNSNSPVSPIVNSPRFVIDSTIIEAMNMKNKLSELMENGTIVLTLPTLKLLDEFEDVSEKQKAYNARHILNLALSHPDSFEHAVVSETDSTEDCLVKYCCGKPNFTLVTSNNSRYLEAKTYKVNAIYFEKIEQNPSYKPNGTSAETNSANTIATNPIPNQKYCSFQNYCPQIPITKEFRIESLNTKKMHVSIIRDNIQYSIGKFSLNVNDHIYICTRQTGGTMDFFDVKILNLNQTNNSEICFQKHLSCLGNIAQVQNPNYRIFIRYCANTLGFLNR